MFASLYRTGFANQPHSVSADDGLRLIDAYVAAVVRCAPPANKPTPEERDNCLPYLKRELDALRPSVIVALGNYAWDSLFRVVKGMDPPTRPKELHKPKFGHGAEADLVAATLIGSYHPSQQNTFTGKLSEEMLDSIFVRARALLTAE